MTHHDCACERAGSVPIVGVDARGMCQWSVGICPRGGAGLRAASKGDIETGNKKRLPRQSV